MNAKLITSLILAGLAAIFIFQNEAMVELKLLYWTLQASMTLTMFLILSSGIITTGSLHPVWCRPMFTVFYW